jgi:hypothetical protein
MNKQTVMKHTPGPWTIKQGKVSQVLSVQDEVGTHIAGTGYDVYDYEQRVANAHLIAAAPDLLVALTDLLNAEYNDTVNPEVIANAVRAIGKASGRVS